jgi:predicted RNase H-like nuclease (RuvC/YqgF family)
VSEDYNILSIKIGHLKGEHVDLKNNFHDFKKNFYSNNFEAKLQKIDSRFESLCLKLDNISDNVDKLEKSDRKQERILYIGTGVFLTIQIATSSAFLPLIKGFVNG